LFPAALLCVAVAAEGRLYQTRLPLSTSFFKFLFAARLFSGRPAALKSPSQ